MEAINEVSAAASAMGKLSSQRRFAGMSKKQISEKMKKLSLRALAARKKRTLKTK